MKSKNYKISRGGGGKIHSLFEKITSPKNLFLAWDKFKKGKIKKTDVRKFKCNLEDNIFNLYIELKDKTYQHSNYSSFYIKDPKLRHIHKACVKDKISHILKL